ncbi:unnamed protein product [Schistosoma margrebowiei]|uniref:Uncharacterized protein n=1 Tax=Schistosoma margrebowiei TaxID=48269 RepID=A0A183LSE8_9TREM|nr:unnamed protein product [Schistosoma margrebowiei]
MELKVTVNQQIQNLHHERQDGSTVRNRNSENHYNHKQSIDQQLSTQDTKCALTRYYQQQPTVEENKSASDRGWD